MEQLHLSTVIFQSPEGRFWLLGLFSLHRAQAYEKVIPYHRMRGINYDIVALSDESGNIIERNSIGVYGNTKIFDNNENEISSSSVGNEYLFQGRRLDQESSLYYFRNRYYSPELGRFISRDPIGYQGDPVNQYRFVGNGPVNALDAWGLKFFSSDQTSLGAHLFLGVGMGVSFSFNSTSTECESCKNPTLDESQDLDIDVSVEYGEGFGFGISVFGVDIGLDSRGNVMNQTSSFGVSLDCFGKISGGGCSKFSAKTGFEESGMLNMLGSEQRDIMEGSVCVETRGKDVFLKAKYCRNTIKALHSEFASYSNSAGKITNDCTTLFDAKIYSFE